MCSTGGGPDVEIEEKVKEGEGRAYRCSECGYRFSSMSRHPICPSCQSEEIDQV
ncbi:hypothetical protein [Methanofollis fontis]|uniref:hypothetical protein n=1 Tax=Methanofollis fontis TaxID=2052832 RepID=UPI0013EE476D|nr:hypothetical protein [Methanofollis fontis]